VLLVFGTDVRAPSSDSGRVCIKVRTVRALFRRFASVKLYRVLVDKLFGPDVIGAMTTLFLREAYTIAPYFRRRGRVATAHGN
jgi:hypothetical protein